MFKKADQLWCGHVAGEAAERQWPIFFVLRMPLNSSSHRMSLEVWCTLFSIPFLFSSIKSTLPAVISVGVRKQWQAPTNRPGCFPKAPWSRSNSGQLGRANYSLKTLLHAKSKIQRYLGVMGQVTHVKDILRLQWGINIWYFIDLFVSLELDSSFFSLSKQQKRTERITVLNLLLLYCKNIFK